MSGNLLLRAADAAPSAHTHLEIGFDDGIVLRFVDPRKFGRVYLFRSSVELTSFWRATRAGFAVDLDAAVLAAKLRGRRGRIKSLLLDQAFLAGIGNLYADEALWEARIHPLARGRLAVAGRGAAAGRGDQAGAGAGASSAAARRSRARIATRTARPAKTRSF